jgi:hypothetical protein
MKSGNIPENLTFFIRPPKKVWWRWEDIEGGNKEFEVSPCYISDSSNKKTLETGRKWADCPKWDYTLNKHINIEYSILETENKPFTNLKIITLEIRDKGGRAYKVCADIGNIKNLYFDMREDVLLDAIFQVGIQPGGIIPGEFIFARVGSEMKPIRIGSFLHAKMIESTEYNSKSKVKSNELKVGGIYQSKSGDVGIYLGQYWTTNLKFEMTSEWIVSHKNKIKSAELEKPVLVHVFHNYWGIKYYLKKDKDYQDLWFYSEEKGYPTVYDLQIVKNHSYKECLGYINPEDIPSDYPQKLISFQLSQFKEQENYFDYHITKYVKLLNLSKEEGFVHSVYQKYLG